MPWNGSGLFTRVRNWVTDKNNGIKIVASLHDSEDDNLANGLNNCVTKDGQSKMAADFAPNSDTAYDLGTSSQAWRNINAKGTMNLLDGVNDGARFYNGSNYVELRAPGTLAANRTFTLPDADGTAGQVLSTNGSGVLSFASVAGDVTGPASSTDFSLAAYNGTTGKLLRNGPALGTAGQILTSNGVGALPTFQNSPGGLTLISSGTTVNQTGVSFSISNSYRFYRIYIQDATMSNTTNTYFGIRFLESGSGPISPFEGIDLGFNRSSASLNLFLSSPNGSDYTAARCGPINSSSSNKYNCVIDLIRPIGTGVDAICTLFYQLTARNNSALLLHYINGSKTCFPLSSSNTYTNIVISEINNTSIGAGAMTFNWRFYGWN